ncbi:MAG: TonB family protein [Candidatus Sulfotelmatobacter sp.]
MPITQIPFQDPVAPPEKAQPEQLGLYDSQGWETAYRDRDDEAHVPHLLVQLQDDLTRSRRREAAWISIITHVVFIILIVNLDKLDRYFPWLHSVMVVPSDVTKGKDLTFLALPQDLQKVPHKPNTNILSDKDRIATTRHPELDPKELRKILATPPPGAPGMTGPKMPQPMPAQSPPALQNSPPAPQAAQPPNNQIAQLQTPAKPNVDAFRKYAGSMSPGAAIQQATQAAAAAKGAGTGGGEGGDFGLGTGAHGRQMGNLEVLSDTQGVDFGPYLARILQDVKDQWYHLIPESAAMKKGKLAIEFAITKDGHVAGMKLVASSGDVALDRPAWGSITGSNPFPPLPNEFGGQYLALRFTFYYNPSKGEMGGPE